MVMESATQMRISWQSMDSSLKDHKNSETGVNALASGMCTYRFTLFFRLFHALTRTLRYRLNVCVISSYASSNVPSTPSVIWHFSWDLIPNPTCKSNICDNRHISIYWTTDFSIFDTWCDGSLRWGSRLYPYISYNSHVMVWNTMVFNDQKDFPFWNCRSPHLHFYVLTVETMYWIDCTWDVTFLYGQYT